jgi:thymidylate synthase (FAD)
MVVEKFDYVNTSDVSLIDAMGSDLTVVNSARVSFGKKKDKFEPKDKKLISYLAKHGHWTPFGHVSLQFHIVAPVFVARQLVKHQVGLVWNEISRRYVDTTPAIYLPDEWRGRAEDKKQGSDEDNIIKIRDLEYEALTKTLVGAYMRMIKEGVCPEQARMILPQSMMTEWYWSGSLMAFARVCNLRCKPDAQLETRVVADQIDKLSSVVAPISWKELRK